MKKAFYSFIWVLIFMLIDERLFNVLFDDEDTRSTLSDLSKNLKFYIGFYDQILNKCTGENKKRVREMSSQLNFVNSPVYVHVLFSDYP